jgi:hypothetical protein
MRRITAPDPYLVEEFARHRDVVKSFVQPVPSTHLYVADLLDSLAPGTYVVHVRAVDEFGAEHTASRVLEITGSSAPPYAR